MLHRKNLEWPKKPRFSFRPDFIAKSVPDVDFHALQEKGIRACFLDLDGTVVERNKYEVNPAIRELIGRTSLKVFVATNRSKDTELRNLLEDLGADGSAHPNGHLGKPFKSYFTSALKDKGLQPHEVVMIGDRYIQDVLGANRSGLYSLVVEKLDEPDGHWDTLLSAAEKRFTKVLERFYED